VNNRGLNFVQFAVGGRVYPSLAEWTRLTERFRGAAIKDLCRRISKGDAKRYEDLSEEQRENVRLFAGKDRTGTPLKGHAHTYFALWPDEDGLPTRLIAFRTTPFTQQEIQALWEASDSPIGWGTGDGEESWKVRLVALPEQTPLPRTFVGPARKWESVTPFVPPTTRFRFRSNGRERLGETPERLVTKLLESMGRPAPATVRRLDSSESWLKLHATRERRRQVIATRTPFVRPGFRLQMVFSEPVRGPLIIGDSSHFGLGLFRTGNDEN